MIFNQLRVIPDEDTLAYLAQLISGLALDINMDAWHVDVITTLDAVTADPNARYLAYATSMNSYYDAHMQWSSLILSLQSEDLHRRAIELNEQGVVREFFNYYNPHMVIVSGMPPLRRRRRGNVKALKDAVCYTDHRLVFVTEHVSSVNLHAPPNQQYHEAMINERFARRNE